MKTNNPLALTLLSLSTIILVGFFTYLAIILDEWSGLLAYKIQYCLISGTFSMVIGFSWYFQHKFAAIVIGILTFFALHLPYLYPAPSSRLLRRAMVEILEKKTEQDVLPIVQKIYAGSGYILPQITKRDSVYWISLLSQDPGDCTALYITIKNGLVVSCSFSED